MAFGPHKHPPTRPAEQRDPSRRTTADAPSKKATNPNKSQHFQAPTPLRPADPSTYAAPTKKPSNIGRNHQESNNLQPTSNKFEPKNPTSTQDETNTDRQRQSESYRVKRVVRTTITEKGRTEHGFWRWGSSDQDPPHLHSIGPQRVPKPEYMKDARRRH